MIKGVQMMDVTKDIILDVQHKMIQDCCLSDSTSDDRTMAQMTMYIHGVNEFAQTLLELLEKG